MLCFLSLHLGGNWGLAPRYPKAGYAKAGYHQMYRQKKDSQHITYIHARASTSETYIFSKYLLHLHTYTINVVPFYYLIWYGALNDKYIPTNCRIFIFKKHVISFNILLVLQIHCRYKLTWFQKCTDKIPKSIIRGRGGGGPLVNEGKASFVLRETVGGAKPITKYL